MNQKKEICKSGKKPTMKAIASYWAQIVFDQCMSQCKIECGKIDRAKNVFIGKTFVFHEKTDLTSLARR